MSSRGQRGPSSLKREQPQEFIPVTLPHTVQSPSDDLNKKVQRAQEQLLEIKRQQEEIEKLKRDLDELKRKQGEFDEGRTDIFERLTRGMVILERQEFESKRELEQIRLVRENFAEQLNHISGLNPNDWSDEERNAELTKALARIDQARAVHNQARAQLSALRTVDDGERAAEAADIESPIANSYFTQEKTMGQMMKDGFAYAFPAFILASLLMAIYLVAHHLLGA